jgi:hypothetical protein
MFDFLTHINLPPYLLFIVIVLGILTYYFHKDISKLITRKWSKENDIKDLKSHDIFNTLERVKQDVSHMKFYTNGVFDANKSRMCSDFAKFKCNVCMDKFVEFLDNDFSKISSDELKQLVLSEMWGMHQEYIKQIRAFWLEKGISNEDVYYVIELFEKFRYDVVVSFQNRINGIFSSSYHKNNFEKILACYEMYSMGIDLLPKDMLTTFEALNGRFANIKYK